MSNDGRLEGKKALVTGAGTGIGREVALEFAGRARTSSCIMPTAEKAPNPPWRRSGDGPASRRLPCRFRPGRPGRDPGDRALDFLGQVDCLVNNAGITLNKPFLQVTPEQFDLLFHVNIRAQFFLTQRIVPSMLAHGGGAVCNLTSIHGLQGAPEHSVYAGTKGAIIAFTRTLAVELAHKGIRVNAIAPGWVTVENYYKAIPGFNEEAARESARDSVPVARPGTPWISPGLPSSSVRATRSSSSGRPWWRMEARRRSCR